MTNISRCVSSFAMVEQPYLSPGLPHPDILSDPTTMPDGSRASSTPTTSAYPDLSPYPSVSLYFSLKTHSLPPRLPNFILSKDSPGLPCPLCRCLHSTYLPSATPRYSHQPPLLAHLLFTKAASLLASTLPQAPLTHRSPRLRQLPGCTNTGTPVSIWTTASQALSAPP